LGAVIPDTDLKRVKRLSRQDITMDTDLRALQIYFLCPWDLVIHVRKAGKKNKTFKNPIK
jgi:hypothetical protein